MMSWISGSLSLCYETQFDMKNFVWIVHTKASENDAEICGISACCKWILVPKRWTAEWLLYCKRPSFEVINVHWPHMPTLTKKRWNNRHCHSFVNIDHEAWLMSKKDQCGLFVFGFLGSSDDVAPCRSWSYKSNASHHYLFWQESGQWIACL